MTDDDRISYLIGDEPAGALDPEERAGLDDLLDVLADRALWAEPSPGLEDQIVAAISVAGPASAPEIDPAVNPAGAPAIAPATEDARATTDTGEPPPGGPPPASSPSSPGSPGPANAPVGTQRGGRRRRRAVAGFIGLAAAVAAVIGLAIGLSGGNKGPIYHAALAGTTLAPGASGEVSLVQTVSGWQITLHAKGLPRLDNGQFYQAWLKNKAGILVPIGTFNQPNNVTLWSGVPPTHFPVVTVTRQKANGNLNSSGQRVLSGTAHEG